jgi:transposase
MKNKYVARSKISEVKFREIMKYFAHDLQANQISELTSLNRNSINSYIKAIRIFILNQTNIDKNIINHMGKYHFFGVVKKGDKVFVKINEQHQYKNIIDFITETTSKLNKKTLLLDGIIDFSHQKYYTTKVDTVCSSMHFWIFTKNRLAKLRGIPAESIYLHLKESEFRYNNRDKDLYRLMLKMFREAPLHL